MRDVRALRKEFYMRIIVNKDKSTKWKIALCVIMLAFGLFIIVASLISFPFQTSKYRTVNGTYYSYREEHGYRSISAYITVETSGAEREEHRIDSIAFPSFENFVFTKVVSVGDEMELTLEGQYIVAIKANGRSYLALEDTLKENRDNAIVGFVLGSAFVLVSLAAFSTQITVKWRKRRHRR